MKARPFEVVRSTGTAVQVRGSPTWYHLSHCVKAPKKKKTPNSRTKRRRLWWTKREDWQTRNTKGCSISRSRRRGWRCREHLRCWGWCQQEPRWTEKKIRCHQSATRARNNGGLPSGRRSNKDSTTTLQEGEESQLHQGDQGQSVKRPSPSVTRTRVEATLGRLVRLPCQCTAFNPDRLLRAQWKDNYGKTDRFLKHLLSSQVCAAQWC